MPAKTRVTAEHERLADPTQAIVPPWRRGGSGMEFELLDAGAFDEDRYFDVVVEYAKGGPDDICIRIEAFNRGPSAATLHVLPHLWFRNTWGWGPAEKDRRRPVITRG